MNCIELFLDQVKRQPHQPALWMPGSGTTTFAELHDLSLRVQRMLRDAGVGRGDSVLLIDTLGPRLYATVIATLAMGATVLIVEPWMAIAQLDRVVDAMSPRVFLTSWFGVPWGLRVPAIRRIPAWRMLEGASCRPGASSLELEDVPTETPGLIAFTTGTTSAPKGVVRAHGYLVKQYEVLRDVLGTRDERGADLCIFANFALLNLAGGRPSVIVPQGWSPKVLRRIDALPDALQPTTMICGPAFLRVALRHARLSKLRAVHVGGAQTDNALFEKGFRKWPQARWLHVYGASEAEPVAECDAREAVRRSKERGLFQTLCLGKPVDAIRAKVEPDTVWVAGPHVCPMYVGNAEENALHKRRDDDGTIWHDMGDRIEERDGLWWYAGRSQQPAADFALEQQIYAFAGSSASFVHRDPGTGKAYLVGDGLRWKQRALLSRFREIDRVVHCRIVRDRRHRARIDRKQTIAKGARWLPG